MTRPAVARAVATDLMRIGLVLGGLAMTGCGGDTPTADTPADGTPVSEATATATVSRPLYFPGPGRQLHAESHDVPVFEETERQIAALVETLLAGPSDEALRAPLGSDVTLRGVYLLDSDKVAIDLDRAEGQSIDAGSGQELLMIYSLVNTVLLNTPDAAAVVLLWNGQQQLTFAGHYDTGRPLAANRALIAADG